MSYPRTGYNPDLAISRSPARSWPIQRSVTSGAYVPASTGSTVASAQVAKTDSGGGGVLSALWLVGASSAHSTPGLLSF